MKTMKHLKSKKRIKRLARGLTFIPGGKQADNALDKLASTAWIFLQAALWNCTKFSTKEQTLTQEKIRDFLRRDKEPRQAFVAFCERALLAKLSLVKSSGGPSLPSAWLNGDNTRGFAGTSSAYKQVKTLRESLPHYKYEWKALTEAVLEFSEEPTASNYRYWTDYFIEKQAAGLLQLFQVFAANYQFII
jgi:hypothetical protein